MRAWLLIAYKVPRDPTSNRVFVWRKLKRLGALLVSDAIWTLPDMPQTREQLEWLAAEIQELGGEASLWEAHSLTARQEEKLVEQFHAQVEGPYREILAELKRTKADPAALARRFQEVHAQDYFHNELGKRVLKALMAARGETEA